MIVNTFTGIAIGKPCHDDIGMGRMDGREPEECRVIAGKVDIG